MLGAMEGVVCRLLDIFIELDTWCKRHFVVEQAATKLHGLEEVERACERK